jgi:hypothetical protein
MARPGDIISHWHHFVEDFNTSTIEFYLKVEEVLRSKEAPVKPDRIDWSEGGILSAKRQYLRATYGRYSFNICAAPFGRDFFFSWWLTKRRPESALMMGCATMIGLLFVLIILVKLTGVVVGFILFIVGVGVGGTLLVNGSIPGAAFFDDMMLGLPVWGLLYARFIKPATFFTEDTRLVFQEAVHTVVVRQVDLALNAKGARALAPEQTKPNSRPLIR